MSSLDLDSVKAILDLPLGRIEDRVVSCRDQAAHDLLAARDAITEAAAKAREYTLELRRAMQQTAVEDEVLLGQASRDMSEIMGEYLRRVDRATAVQEKAAQRALNDSSGILELLKQLQKVARSSKLVALNAAAWAERFKANGPLALLVDQMGALNRDINKETRSIAQAVTELLSVLPSLVERITRLRLVSQKFITDGTAQATAVEHAVALLRERAQSVGQNGDRRAVEVTHAAEEASRRLDCYAAFARCFEQLNDILGRVASGEWRDDSPRKRGHDQPEWASQAPEDSIREEQEERLMSKKIIVVDDSQTVRQQVTLALNQGGYTVLEAVDGLDGFDTIQRNPDVALVICDVNMPRKNGLEMLEALKQAGRVVPVVMLTTEGQPQLIDRAKKAGAKGWIIKPFKADLLLAAARKICGA